MKNQFKPDHKVFIDEDCKNNQLFYFNVFGDISSIRLDGIDIEWESDNDSIIYAEINPSKIKDIYDRENWDTLPWMISADRYLLELYRTESVYKKDICIYEYPTAIEISYVSHPLDWVLVEPIISMCNKYGFEIHNETIDSTKVKVCIACMYDNDNMEKIIDVIKIIPLYKRVREKDPKYQIVCCPNCYNIKGNLRTTRNTDLIFWQCATDDETCHNCGAELENGYITVDYHLYYIVKRLGTSGYCKVIECCESHPEINENRAYVFGMIDPELYDVIVSVSEEIEDSMNVYVEECNIFPHDHAEYLVPKNYKNFSISVRDIYTNDEKLEAIVKLNVILDGAIRRMIEE